MAWFSWNSSTRCKNWILQKYFLMNKVKKVMKILSHDTESKIERRRKLKYNIAWLLKIICHDIPFGMLPIRNKSRVYQTFGTYVSSSFTNHSKKNQPYVRIFKHFGIKSDQIALPHFYFLRLSYVLKNTFLFYNLIVYKKVT